jgi:ATP-dependent helicase/nuclease subunit A
MIRSQTGLTCRPADQQARREALDPTRSFIVQAPAGSGKTSLLTQRFLTLLGGVSEPEEILAITFTRKAAGEMRERILQALHVARDEAPPEDEFALQTWTLGRKALRRNDERRWNLLENPARLRVLTIDSLCARLARGLPILSQFGASPQAVDDASEYYLQAARLTLAAVHDSNQPHAEAVAHLLLHLDNDLLRVQEQVAEMLARRDKWMRPLVRVFGDLRQVGADSLRAALEQTLKNVTSIKLGALKECLGPERLHRLIPLIQYAATQLGPGSFIEPWRDLTAPPSTRPETLPLWQGLRQFLLTHKGDWRKSMTKSCGFPAPGKAKEAGEKAERKLMKRAMKGLLEELSSDESLRLLLVDAQNLPPARYTDEQWSTLQALLQVSRLAAAQLTLVFRNMSITDFVEVSHRAERALGTDAEPTDLAMAMDSRLQHLLVDEFQDTSQGQLQLLRRLTAEWIPDEGKTLFLVGDPMQSIYRFRDAEVGLFLQVRELGLGNLMPEPLLLTSNFRSQSGLVDWFNQSFSQIFPAAEDPGVGSVRYSVAEAAREPDGVAVHCWGVSGPDELQKQKEAETVLQILRNTWEAESESSVAILVRSRSHLEQILPLLKSHGYRFQGVDLEPLSEKQSVRDLHSLTLALCRPDDRLSWLSVLRAPWCGLNSEDLFLLARSSQDTTLLKGLAAFEELENLSDEGRRRIAGVWPILHEAIQHRGRHPLRRWIESTWLALGGPAGLISATSLSDCQTYLNLLDQVEAAGVGDPLELLGRKMNKLFAQADVTADGKLQIMTIHKSKGLEFDTVILPGLANSPRHLDEPLVSWIEWNDPYGDSELLLAPVTAKGQERDPVYTFVRSLEKKKEENESARLLYVAATRAKKKLHLVARVEHDEKEDFGALKPPRRGTFLELLWPVSESEFSLSSNPMTELTPQQTPNVPPLQIRRLRKDWKPPELPADLVVPKIELLDDERTEEPKFEWAGETVKHVGTVVHRVLQQVGREGLPRWNADRLRALEPYLSSKLSAAGVPPDALPGAVNRCQTALKEALSSRKGRWILDPRHQEARSEYAISGVWGGRLVRSVVDRTFVDSSGTRWVIDYKTGTHQGTDSETFLEREVERYRPQLNRYARLLKRMDGRPVKMGLYFPLLKAWREWSLEEVSRPQQLQFEFL